MKRILAIAAFAAATAACANGVPNSQTVTDATIGLNAAVCVLNTYAQDMHDGGGQVDVWGSVAPERLARKRLSTSRTYRRGARL